MFKSLFYSYQWWLLMIVYLLMLHIFADLLWIYFINSIKLVIILVLFLFTIVQNVFWYHVKNINNSNEKQRWKKKGECLLKSIKFKFSFIDNQCCNFLLTIILDNNEKIQSISRFKIQFQFLLDGNSILKVWFLIFYKKYLKNKGYFLRCLRINEQQ